MTAVECDTFPMRISLVPICRRRDVPAPFGQLRVQWRL